MTENKPSATDRAHEVLDPTWEEALRRGQEEEGERGSVEPELAMLHLLRHARAPESLRPEELDAMWADIEAEVAPAGVPWWRKAWVWWTAPVLATAAVVAIVVIQPSASEAPTLAQKDQSSAARPAPASADEAREQSPEGEAPGAAPLDDGIRAAKKGEAAASRTAANEELAEDAPADGDAVGAAGPAAAGGAIAAGDVRSRSAGANAFESSYIQLEPQGRAALLVAVDQSRDQLRDQLLADARGGGR